MKILNIASIKKNSKKNNFRVGGPEASVVNFSIALSKKYTVGLFNIASENKITLKNISYFSNLSISNVIYQFGKPDYIFIHEVYFLKIIPIIFYCNKNNIKVYIFPRGAFSRVARKVNSFKKFIFYNFIFSFLIKKISGFVALNEGEKKEINNLYKNINIKIIPNGANIIYKKNKLIKNKNNLNKNRNFVIGYVGRFDFYIKGLDILINEYQSYLSESKHKNVKLKFIGEHRSRMGYSSLELINLFNKKNKKNMIIVEGPFYGEKKYKKILALDALILSSRSEGMPNTVIEAMSLGIPVIVTPQTNVSKIVKKTNCGWLITHQKNIIKKLFLNFDHIDKLVSIKMGLSGFDFFKKKLRWDVIVKKCFLKKTLKSYIP